MLDILRHFHPISQADYDLLTADLKTKTFKKGEFIVSAGQTQRELYFVRSGVQMSFFDSEHKSHVIAFTYAPGLCAIPDSFSFQQPSQCSLMALSDSELGCLSFAQLQTIFDQAPAIERLFRKMTEAILAGVIQRHIELHSLSMQERFKRFCQRSPHLLQLVPHKYLASYLGIDATNFSKLYNGTKIDY